ncbi:hypothetical protein SAMN02745866_03946 [Alteromonadaceae bacterium Bs31]|nr:hypothetical protein SAMN02745866_03946 [Alteromonadaceae bacterium Bs31]
MKKHVFLFFVFFSISTSYATDFNVKKLVKKNWLSLVTPHFHLVTDLQEKDAMELLQDLEEFRFLIVEVLGVQLSDELAPLPLLAIENGRYFGYLALPKNIGGVFNYHSEGYSAVASVQGYSLGGSYKTKGRHTLLHEYFHFITFLSDGGVEKQYPGWYLEGMAEYWATFRREKNLVVVGDPGPVSDRIYDLYLGVATGEGFTDTKNFLKQDIPALKDQSEENSKALNVFYARAFFVVHYLQSSSSLRKSTGSYVKDVTAGVDPDFAFRNAFGISYQQLDRDIKKYIVDGRMEARAFLGLNKNIDFPLVKSEIKHLEKGEKYLFFAKLCWNFGLMAAEPEDRIKLLQQAIKYNPKDEDLPYYLDILQYVRKHHQAP